MNLNQESINPSYMPVAYEYREIIDEQIIRKTRGRINFFCVEQGICDAEGSIKEMREVSKKGIYILLDTGVEIRIDRIITLFGKPGAAYDEYDAYANACMNCNGGEE